MSKRIWGVALFLVGQVLLAGHAPAAECVNLESASSALRYLRDHQIDSPRSTAECFTRSLSQLPDASSAVDIDTLRSYLREGADLLLRLHKKAPRASPARRGYVAAELTALSAYREMTLSRIEANDGTPQKLDALKDAYANGVDAESNAFWRQSEDGEKERGLLELQTFFVDLKPIYLLDKTAVRLIEAARTCPKWIPASPQTPLADYTSAWCPADECREQFNLLSDKLTAWWKERPQPEGLLSFSRRQRMESDVKTYCKG